MSEHEHAFVPGGFSPGSDVVSAWTVHNVSDPYQVLVCACGYCEVVFVKDMRRMLPMRGVDAAQEAGMGR